MLFTPNIVATDVIYMFMSKSDSSDYAWRETTGSAMFIQLGTHSDIGNWKSTYFWMQSWASFQPLLNDAVQIAPSNLLHLKVEDFWENGSCWRWETFADFLPQEILKYIASFQLLQDDNAIDELL